MSAFLDVFFFSKSHLFNVYYQSTCLPIAARRCDNEGICLVLAWQTELLFFICLVHLVDIPRTQHII